MEEEILRVVESIKKTYPVEESRVKEGWELLMSNREDRIAIWDEGRECMVFDDEWHQHCHSEEELRELLSRLFEGRARIVVKCRGDASGSHQLQFVDGAEVEVVRQTSSLLSPFWRKKSYAVITYTSAEKRVERTDSGWA